MKKQVKCIYCGYEWEPRKDPNIIKCCPDCKKRRPFINPIQMKGGFKK